MTSAANAGNSPESCSTTTPTTYDTEGRVFCDPDGICYTNRDSRVDITFPYTPKTEYVKNRRYGT